MIEAPEGGFRLSYQGPGVRPLEPVGEDDAAGSDIADPAPDPHDLIEAQRLTIANRQFRHDEPHPRCFQLAVGIASLSEVLRACDVEPDDVTGMIDHAHLVGLGIVHSVSGDGFGDRLVHRGPLAREKIGSNVPPRAPKVKVRLLAGPLAPAYLGPVRCQRLVLVGDAHLGRGAPEAEPAFISFLDRVPDLGDGLVVVGDLFEFWFAYRRVVPRRCARVVAALAQLRRRVPVLMVGGNHDRWAGDFWAGEFGIEFQPVEARFDVGGRPAAVIHGDGLTETHWTARVLHRILRREASVRLFSAVHPDAGLWLVDRLSGFLGDRERTPMEIAASAARQRAWAEARLRQEPDLALLAMGHTHRAAALTVEPGRLYVNPGAWFDGYRYAVVANGHASLMQFSP